MSEEERAIPQADIPSGAIPEKFGPLMASRKQAAPLLKLIKARLKPAPHKPKTKKKTWKTRVNYY